jgi:hypothetical protein
MAYSKVTNRVERSWYAYGAHGRVAMTQDGGGHAANRVDLRGLSASDPDWDNEPALVDLDRNNFT